ncbi:unnamed protein product [Somion occarium]|uniref:Uncharacterized protein n=1 Tax=Somion occarium TaxID=3059160 RepID=A0ABP1DG66_9APHY
MASNSQKNTREQHDPTVNDDLESMETLFGTAGADSSLGRLEDSVSLFQKPSRDTYFSQESKKGLVIGAVGLIGCYTLKYFVRPSNLLRKRVWIGSTFGVLSYDAIASEVQQNRFVRTLRPDNELQTLSLSSLIMFFTSMNLMSAQKAFPKLDDELISYYRDFRSTTTGATTSITERISQATRAAWSSENSRAICWCLFANSLLRAGVAPRDVDICICNLALWADLPLGRQPLDRKRDLAVASWTGAVIVRLLTHRRWLSRISAPIAISSLFFWFTVDRVRGYYTFYEPSRIEQKEKVAKVYKDHILLASDIQKLNKRLEDNGLFD